MKSVVWRSFGRISELGGRKRIPADGAAGQQLGKRIVSHGFRSIIGSIVTFSESDAQEGGLTTVAARPAETSARIRIDRSGRHESERQPRLCSDTCCEIQQQAELPVLLFWPESL